MARVNAFSERIQAFGELLDASALTGRALEEAVARLEMLVNENGGKETAALTVP